MGGKKKKAGGGGKEGDEEDLSVDNFMKAYRKKCAELGCEVSKIVREKYDVFQEEGEPLDKVISFKLIVTVPLLGGDGMARSASSNRRFETSQVRRWCPLTIHLAILMPRLSAFGRHSVRMRAAELSASVCNS